MLVVVTAAKGPPPPPPIVLSMVAVHATKEGSSPKSYDPALKEVRAALEDLKFDTYRLICTQTVSARHNEESKVAISPDYTLYVKPLSKDPGGKVRVSVRIEMPPKKEGEKPVNALSTTLVIVPGKQFVLGGLELDKGELVIVMALKDDPHNPSVHGSLRFRFSF